MKDELVTIETAKLAKEKGFSSESYLEPSNYCITPTQSLLQRWLREVHNIHVEIWFDNTQLDGFPYLYEIYNQQNQEGDINGHYFDNYEEALEEGLQEALKLIETKPQHLT
jgi:hypothetical protein